MTEKTLVELSAESKTKFGAGEHHAAARILTEARNRFPQEKGDEIDQGPDGSLLITTRGFDAGGSHRVLKQVAVESEKTEDEVADEKLE